jgi:diadenosine tetraphosphate (Ap4A) HIT family hydrolase
MVRQCRAGQCAPLVAAVESGWVILAERQVTAGYCLLLPDPVVGHLNELSGGRRAAFLRDMGNLGDVLLRETGAVRINYAIFGNVEPALHLHAFPRYSDEPAQTRTAQPWALNWNSAPVFSEAVHGGLKRRIAAGLAASRSSP